MVTLAILLAAGAATVTPQTGKMTLADFLDAMEGRCWVVDAKGIAVPRENLAAITGTVDVECLAAEPAEDRRI